MTHLSLASIALAAVANLTYLPQVNANAHQNLRQTKNVNSSNAEENTQAFDFFVLSMSFQPEFCHAHKRDGYAGCEDPQEFWRGSLTLHGLWPENNDGSWPSTCTNEKFNPKTVSDLGPDRFDKLWPNVKSSESSRDHTSFWDHEWTKHGTCTGLAQDDYFDTAMKHFLPTPTIVRDNYGAAVATSDLIAAYRADLADEYGDVVLVCSGGRYLSEVRVCVAKNKDGSGSHRIECIPQVAGEGNCGSEITIAKFYIDEEDEVALVTEEEEEEMMDVKVE